MATAVHWLCQDSRRDQTCWPLQTRPKLRGLRFAEVRLIKEAASVKLVCSLGVTIGFLDRFQNMRERERAGHCTNNLYSDINWGIHG